MISLQHQRFVAVGFGQLEAATANVVRGAQIAGKHMVKGLAIKRDELLLLVTQTLAEQTGPAVGRKNLGRAGNLGRCHAPPERTLELKF